MVIVFLIELTLLPLGVSSLMSGFDFVATSDLRRLLLRFSSTSSMLETSGSDLKLKETRLVETT